MTQSVPVLCGAEDDKIFRVSPQHGGVDDTGSLLV